MEKLAAFVRRNYKPAQKWSDDSLKDWLQWASDNRFLGLVFDEGDLVGLSIFRPINEAISKHLLGPSDEHDEDGDTIYVDLAISTKGKQVIQAILFCILARLGNRAKIAFNQHKRSDRLRVHDLRKFKDFLFNRGTTQHG
jgi:hypothetical protein